MQGRMRVRAPDGALVGAIPDRRPGPRHPRGGRRHVSAFDQESILELQRLAGNAAVAKQLVGSKRNGRIVMGVDTIKLNQHASAAPGGLADIRKLKKGAGILGYTVRSIADWAPILRPEAPSKDAGGWTTKARSINFVPEPEFEEYWPTKGRHEIAERNYLDIDKDWEDKIHEGEDQHVADASYAWKQTWKKVADAINGLAKKAGPPHGTEDAAIKDLWRRYRAALPDDSDLIPKGDVPTESAQRALLSPDHKSMFRWMFETTYVRDTRGYHNPAIVPSHVSGDAAVSHIEKGPSEIPGPTTPELSEQLRKKFVGEDIKGTENFNRSGT